MRDKMKTARDETPTLEPENTDTAAGAHAPRQMTFGENIVLTIKVLAGFGLLGAALWGINLWTSAR